MNYSDNALKILALRECGYIKTNAQFWREFGSLTAIDVVVEKEERVKEKINFLEEQFESVEDSGYGMVCVFDDEFPEINIKAKDSEKPYLLFYKGDISLVNSISENVAVIGLIDPTTEIETREREIVNRLVKNNLIIVSGLANGCDCIAHKVCVENNAKTVAVLPSTLNKIYPAANRKLADEIVENGGLLLTEYFNEPLSKRESIARFIERDRLQAMFAKAVIMIASYVEGQGDSGSRHAMNFAESFGVPRYVMFNRETDETNKQFALNRQFYLQQKAKILTGCTVDEIIASEPPKAVKLKDNIIIQTKLF